MVLPFIEQKTVYDQYRWDQYHYDDIAPQPSALRLGRTRIKTFICPSDKDFPNQTEAGWNNYGVSEGSNKGYNVSVQDYNGMFARARFRGFNNVTDGLSNTILAAEFVKGDDNNSRFTIMGDIVKPINHDAYPNQFWTQANLDAYGQACLSGSGTHLSFAGFRWSAPGFYNGAINTLAPPNWKWPACQDCSGCGQADSRGVFPSRSRHPGGTMHAMGDGSVRFVAQTIDLVTYQGMGSADGNDVFQNSP
jgi:hypothetical protein